MITLAALERNEVQVSLVFSDSGRPRRPVDRIICVCRSARRTFGTANVDPSRYAVIHNGVISRKPGRGRAEVRAELGIKGNSLILTVARFSEQKHHTTLVDALPLLLESQPDVQLLWAGSGLLQEHLSARAGRLGAGRTSLSWGGGKTCRT